MADDGLRWVVPRRSGASPPGRWGHSLFSVSGTHLVLFGGLANGKMFNDTWTYEVVAGVWTQAATSGTPPAPRWGHSACLVGTRSMIVLGGRQGSKPLPLNECFLLDLTTMVWNRIELPKPAPKNRYAHSGCLLSDGSTILVFAGHGGRTRYYKDIHMLDTRTMKWTSPKVSGATPPKRSGHSMSIVGRFCVVYGGFNGKSILSDLWVLDMGTLSWAEVAVRGATRLPPLVGHSCNAIGNEGQLLIYGGSSSSSQLSQHVFLLDTASLVARIVPTGGAPQLRFWHRCTVSRSILFCFGGSGSKGVAFDDLYAADTRTVRTALEPSARFAPPGEAVFSLGPDGQLQLSRTTAAAGVGPFSDREAGLISRFPAEPVAFAAATAPPASVSSAGSDGHHSLLGSLMGRFRGRSPAEESAPVKVAPPPPTPDVHFHLAGSGGAGEPDAHISADVAAAAISADPVAAGSKSSPGAIGPPPASSIGRVSAGAATSLYDMFGGASEATGSVFSRSDAPVSHVGESVSVAGRGPPTAPHDSGGRFGESRSVASSHSAAESKHSFDASHELATDPSFSGPGPVESGNAIAWKRGVETALGMLHAIDPDTMGTLAVKQQLGLVEKHLSWLLQRPSLDDVGDLAPTG